MFIKRRKQIIRDHVVATFSKISVTTGKCRYNFQCHSNAIHEAIMKKQDKIALVVYFDTCNYPIVHFINYTSKQQFKDNTLGVWASKYEYYFIRWIPECEFDDVHKIHLAMRVKIKSFLPLWLKPFASLEAH